MSPLKTIGDSTRPESAGTRWGVACALALASLAMMLAGPAAAAAVAAGALVGIVSGRSLATLLRTSFADPADVRGARRRTVLTALFRYPLLGGALAACVLLLDLPAAWLALGVTTWPVTLLAAAWRWGRSEDAGALPAPSRIAR